ncbi:ATP-binding protein [Kitasatospora sp. NPDC088391]|uniref:ATP-binding protein n=1 Tax=Kitasatospora sp. NPDC088391 TaxID=3364074 RepID=UPI003819B90A
MTTVLPEETPATTQTRPPMRKRPPLVVSLDLAAVLTAVSCSRLFIRHTLGSWNLPQQIDTAELVVSELVTNAVKATGLMTPDPEWSALENLSLLNVRILGRMDCICIQVWDTGVEPLDQPAAGPSDDAEGGRGLFIVKALARQVGHYYPKTGGKVVWAELALDGPVPALPRRTSKKPTTISLPRSDPDLLRQVLKGLHAL